MKDKVVLLHWSVRSLIVLLDIECDLNSAVTRSHTLPQMELMTRARQSIMQGAFPEFVRRFVADHHPAGDCPPWARDALASVGIEIA